MPELNINTSLDQQYQLNFKLISRDLFGEGRIGEFTNNNFEHILTDLSLILSRKVGFGNKLGAGYQGRIRDGNYSHRLMQQYTKVVNLSALRLGHRLAMDQSFGSDIAFRFRMRYRLAMEFPLNGDSVNRGEHYLKLSNEYLNEIEKSDYDLEIRVSPILGYLFSDRNKLEYGLEYRLNSFINSSIQHRIWFLVKWYIKL